MVLGIDGADGRRGGRVRSWDRRDRCGRWETRWEMGQMEEVGESGDGIEGMDGADNIGDKTRQKVKENRTYLRWETKRVPGGCWLCHYVCVGVWFGLVWL